MITGVVTANHQAIIALTLHGSALVGMALLMGSRVTLEVEDGGLVTIDRLP